MGDGFALGSGRQGMKFVTTFYWDRNDETRAFARRFKERTGQMPSQVHAGMYSSTLAYLRAVNTAGTDDGKPRVSYRVEFWRRQDSVAGTRGQKRGACHPNANTTFN